MEHQEILEIVKMWETAFQTLRIHYGPGIRIYYSRIGSKVILLLCGGDKGSQVKDINKAKEYLINYQSRENRHDKK